MLTVHHGDERDPEWATMRLGGQGGWLSRSTGSWSTGLCDGGKTGHSVF